MDFLDEIRSSCRGRHWPCRAVLLLWLLWVGWRCTLSRTEHTIFDGINLGIHEGGHVIFSIFGRFPCVAGGTITQLLAPIAAACVLFRQRDWFGVGAMGTWLATNFFGAAVYAADAQAQALPLVTIGGGEAMHDWTYLLGRLGILRHDQAVGNLLRGAGLLVLWVSLAFTAWIVWTMIRSREGEAVRRPRGIVRDLPRPRASVPPPVGNPPERGDAH